MASSRREPTSLAQDGEIPDDSGHFTMRAVGFTLVLLALACGTKRGEVISLGPSHDASPAVDGSVGCDGADAQTAPEAATSGGAPDSDGADTATAPEAATSGGAPDSAGADAGTAPEAGTSGGAPDSAGADAGTAPEAAIEAAIAPETAADGKVCTTLANTAPAVPMTTGDDTVATGVGGSVLAGTYYLTAVLRTPSSILPQMTFRQTLRISDNTIESVSQDNDQPANNEVTTFTTDGSSIVFTGICSTRADSGGSLQYDSYTADASHLILYGVTIGITVTFTRQG
jgi:hypothetical protein